MSRREENRKQRRAEVLRTARRLIAAGGVEALTMRGLANEAGVAVNTVYALFGRSREDILAAVVEEGQAELDRMLHEKEAEDPIDLGRNFVTTIADFIIENERVFRPVLLAEAHAEIGWGDARAIAQGRESLEEARDEGVLREDTDLELFSEHIFQSFRILSWRWARHEIEADEFRSRWLYAVQLALLGAASDEARPALEKAFRATERSLSRGRRGKRRGRGRKAR